MKKRFVVSMLALASLGLVGCGGTTSETTSESNTTPTKKDTIVIGSPTTNHDFVKTQVEGFLKSKNLDTKYTIKMYDLPEGETSNITDWTAETSPDVYAFASDKIGSLKSVGAISTVPSVFVEGLTETVNTESLEAGKIADTLYGYPYSGDNGYFLYYNKSLVPDAATANVDDLIAACAASGTKFAYGMDLGSSFFSIGAFMTYGSRFKVNFNEDGSFASASSNFSSAEGIKAATAVYNILHNENVIAFGKESRDTIPNKANGIGAIVEGSWKYDEYKKALGDDLGLCKLPTVTVDGETKNLSSFLGYKLYGVNDKKSAGNADRLSTLHMIANFLVSDEVQQARFDTLNVIPTSKKVSATTEVQNSPLAKALIAQSQFAVAQTACPNKIWDAGDIACQSIKTATSTDELANIMKTFDDSVAQSTSF